MGSNNILSNNLVRERYNKIYAKMNNFNFIHENIYLRMAERLEYIKFIPASILDIGSGVEIDASALKTKFKQAKLYKLDFALNMIKKYRHQDNLLKNIFNPSTLNVCADALNLPIQENSIDMVWSNLCLPLIDDMDKFFNEIYRVLNYSGFFLISGLGVDSLEQLRQLGLKTFNFPDMHLIGDLLVKNNFSHAVTDVEKITLEYKDSATLFNDLKLINFLNPQTETNWLGKNKYNHLKNEIERQLKNDSFKITLEIFYAHAWKEEPLPKNNFAQKAIKIYPRKTK